MSCDYNFLKMKIIESDGIDKMILAAQKHEDQQLYVQVCEAFSNICRG